MSLLEPDNHGTTQDTSRIECPRSTARNVIMVKRGMRLKQDSHVRLAKTLLEIRGLLDLGAHVSFFDPLVTSWESSASGLERVSSLATGLRETQIAVLLQAHSTFDFDMITKSGTCILDTRGVLNGPNVVRL